MEVMHLIVMEASCHLESHKNFYPIHMSSPVIHITVKGKRKEGDSEGALAQPSCNGQVIYKSKALTYSLRTLNRSP
jgi:hypothetical protein